MMTTTPTTADRVLLALHDSECGALTDVAIREQVPNGMRAVPALVRQGAVTTTVEPCWIDNHTRVDAVTVRLVNLPCEWCGAADGTVFAAADGDDAVCDTCRAKAVA